MEIPSLMDIFPNNSKHRRKVLWKGLTTNKQSQDKIVLLKTNFEDLTNENVNFNNILQTIMWFEMLIETYTDV